MLQMCHKIATVTSMQTRWWLKKIQDLHNVKKKLYKCFNGSDHRLIVSLLKAHF